MFITSEQMLQCPPRGSAMDRRWKSSVELAPNCPRCASSNTKFCYYNNYSLSQPRYFCKGCRRYWTKGGSLRNVPVGGGCRRNRRGKSNRVPQTEQFRMTDSRSMPGSDPPRNEPFGNSNGDSLVHVGSTTASDIDLAVVFAKFLNQNSSFENEFVGSKFPSEANISLGVPNSTSNLDFQQEDIMIDCQKLSDLIGEAEIEPEEFPQVVVGQKQQEEKMDQEFMDSDLNALGLQSLLGEEVVQEALWPHASAALPDFSWQPSLVQFQEFESISPDDDDQLKISSNTAISDNWSSINMSGFDVFLRP